MHIGELLSVNRITVNLAVGNRADALEALATSFARDCDIDPASIRTAFEAREELASTNIGVGVAVPHARIAGVGAAKIAVAVCPEGLAYDGADDKPVRILVALLAEEEQPRASLEALVAIARTFKHESLRKRISCARSASEILEALMALEADAAAAGAS